MSQEIPWKKFSVESIVIIASILLALAVDAWWDDRQERKDELRLLENLLSDFISTRELLVEELPRHELLKNRAMEAAEWGLSPAETPQPAFFSEPATLLRLLFGFVSTQIVTGALDGAIASGNLGIISNDGLRGVLASWEGTYDEFAEQERFLNALTIDARATLAESAQIARDVLNVPSLAEEGSMTRDVMPSAGLVGFVRSTTGQNYLAFRAQREARAEQEGKVLFEYVNSIIELIEFELRN